MAKKGKKREKQSPEEPFPGTAAMGQGQPGAGIEAPDADRPEQPDRLVTGQDALAEIQQNPDLEDNTGNRGGA